jgi:hypothetical protein
MDRHSPFKIPHGAVVDTFISPQIFGNWQRCQISRLFLEDAQGAQVINLTILPGRLHATGLA